ncbi:SpoIIE family protein phosphatase [Desulfolutivibrio sulfoxidireducens]|uniref:SpoIIE family protein phosphatase n=1 Tax=Desulfolutivibrio sulfoxidireducens TaxID=2773299 RepID=UPI00159D6502|nr:SpoIIE family protein phosphatase [Desulfolutivibrio sulfoxidireducens]QLA17298.1 SpoIIE family protein phosphatase [Desulfolutivibrio sulfoxidireducens]QLA20863.1 SpoIIE family protein phosphatase [Desulfolutivibrio sulfoxidireducens]
MRILIVDDSDAFRVSLRVLLDRVDLLGGPDENGIMEARGGEEALEVLTREAVDGGRGGIDLVLLDLLMPGLGGIETLSRIKADPNLRDIPVIMITISDDEDSLTRSFAAGALDYIKKPVRMAELAVRVTGALRLKRETDACKSRERELRAEKEFTAAILEHSCDGIAVAAPDGAFVFCGPGMERIFGYPAGSFESLADLAKAVFPEATLVEDVNDNRPEGNPSGHVWSGIYPFVDKNRQSRFCQIHFSYLPDGDLVMNIQDVTFLERQKRELLKKQSRHQKDLEAAAEIQRSLLPRRFSMNPAFRFAWEFRPCETVGGDIFNVFPLGPDHVGLYMLDVSGHGVASSLVALSVYNFMHYQRSTLIDRFTGGIQVACPKDVLTRLDWEFPFFKFSKFFTIVYMVLELRTGLLTYANAGHPAPVATAPDGGLESLDERGTIIGLEGFAPFEEYSRGLSPGEKVLLYSDGLVDFQNAAGEYFGEKRLLDVLSATASRPVTEVVETAGKAIGRFSGQAKPRDDISLLGLEYLGPEA